MEARFGLRALVFRELDSFLELLCSLLVQALTHEKVALVLILRRVFQFLLLFSLSDGFLDLIDLVLHCVILDPIKYHRLLLAHLEVLEGSILLASAVVDLAGKFIVYFEELLAHELSQLVNLLWDSFLKHFENLLHHLHVIGTLFNLKDNKALHADLFPLDVLIESSVRCVSHALRELLASSTNEFCTEFRLELDPS